ncbi:hypothetical protein [Abyssalbus ytuae]|uniref:Uncharacterized protein n=1 Tax=Abyssalbus ytuae TaxID=2926907 RepID=A0A9E6ZUS6_9FLAO|nr:hypothetical protein [Abyssalbus ytuae]UOB18193.1 hypothetical protein MQE35_02580 [Abyssalbus ytuae]
MKKILLLLLFIISASGYSQKAIYENNAFESLSKHHKKIAILPFTAKLELKDQEGISEDKMKKLQEHEGYEVQNALETYFLKKRRRKDYIVDFQDIKNTNALLTKNGINSDNIDIYTTQELCNILGVDAVINGNLTLNALISKGVSTSYDLISFITGKSDYGRIAIKISDGNTGKLLWKYEKAITRKSGKNTFAIIEDMMKKITRKFPYDKEKIKVKEKNKQ